MQGFGEVDVRMEGGGDGGSSDEGLGMGVGEGFDEGIGRGFGGPGCTRAASG